MKPYEISLKCKNIKLSQALSTDSVDKI